MSAMITDPAEHQRRLVRAARAYWGWSRKTAARRARVSAWWIVQYEHGRAPDDPTSLAKLLRALDSPLLRALQIGPPEEPAP